MVDPWYARDIRKAITGMARLTLEERGAYNTIIDHQYLMGGPLPDDDRHLAGLMGCDLRVWKRIKKQLLAKDRIKISAGHIEDVRASSELAKRDDQRKQRVASGQLGGKASAKTRKNNHLSEAPASDKSNHIRGDKRKEETSPNGLGADAPLSFSKFIYHKGKELLAKADKPPKDPGALITKWLREHGEQAVLDALRRAEAKDTPEVVAFIEGCLRGGKREQPREDIFGGMSIPELGNA